MQPKTEAKKSKRLSIQTSRKQVSALDLNSSSRLSIPSISLLSIHDIPPAQRKKAVAQLQRTFGNQFLQTTILSNTQASACDTDNKPQTSETMIQRRVLGTITPRSNSEGVLAKVHTRTIDGWRTLLSDADNYYNALNLNAFMAKAVAHRQFTATSDPEYRFQQEIVISMMEQPSTEECINLMIAMLSTQSVDLREIGTDMPSITGYLLQRFIKKYYRSAMNYASEQMGKDKNPGKWLLDPSNLVGFIDEAESTYQSTANLAPHRISDVLIGPDVTDNNLPGIGVHGSKETPTNPIAQLQIEAIAGVQAAIAIAFNEASQKDGNPDDAADKGQRHIRNHAIVLRGIMDHKQAEEKIQEAMLNAVISLAFAAAGPIVPGINALGNIIANETTRRVIEAVVLQAAQAGATAMASTLNEASSSEQMKKALRTSVINATQAWINTIRNYPVENKNEKKQDKNKSELPRGIMTVATALEQAFHAHTD